MADKDCCLHCGPLVSAHAWACDLTLPPSSRNSHRFYGAMKPISKPYAFSPPDCALLVCVLHNIAKKLHKLRPPETRNARSPASCICTKSRTLSSRKIAGFAGSASDQDFTPESLTCFWVSVNLSHAEGHPPQQKAIFCPL